MRGFGVFRRHRFADLRAHDASVPTVDEVLDVSGDLFLNAEIKNSPTQEDHDPQHRATRLLAEWAEARGLGPRLLVSSFNGDTVDQMRFTG